MPYTNDAKGAVIVELAIALPLLALFLLSAVDLGLVIWEHQVLQNAAREGARFSALPRSWVDPRNPTASLADIRQRVIAYCLEEGITVNASDITINQNFQISVGGFLVRASEVTVSYNRSFLIPGSPLLPFAQMTLTGRAVFRNLY